MFDCLLACLVVKRNGFKACSCKGGFVGSHSRINFGVTVLVGYSQMQIQFAEQRGGGGGRSCGLKEESKGAGGAPNLDTRNAKQLRLAAWNV